MKTIKLLVLVLLSTLFLSCSQEEDYVFLEEIAEEEVLVSKTYHFKQYYEKPVVINSSTNGNDIDGYRAGYDRIHLGVIIFQGKHKDNEVIDTLTIDLASFDRNIKELILDRDFHHVGHTVNKYATINYLNIIGLDKHPDLKIEGDEYGLYGKVQIYNSNVSVAKLNSISRTNKLQKIDIFEEIDYERKEWEWTLMEGSDDTSHAALQDKPIGYIGYVNRHRTGIKTEIMNIIENYE